MAYFYSLNHYNFQLQLKCEMNNDARTLRFKLNQNYIQFNRKILIM